MRNCVSFFLSFVVCLLIFPADVSAKPEPIKVVASFSILADWIQVVGAEQVDVQSLVKKDEDVHVYKATPQDMALLSGADLLVVNGMNLEGWMGRIINASGYSGNMLVASKGIDVLTAGATNHDLHHHQIHAHTHDGEKALLDNAVKSQRSIIADSGYADPHAWTSLREARVYVNNIASALAQLKPEYAELFDSRRTDYIEKLDAMDRRARDAFSAVPKERRNIVIPQHAIMVLTCIA